MKKITLLSILSTLCILYAAFAHATETIHCWFPPSWINKSHQAKEIADALALHSGLPIKPRIATSYPQILEEGFGEEEDIIYVGSFVQAIIESRGIGTSLVQAINGKEFYSGVFVFPKEENPEAILKNFPEEIAYAKGASSGESSALAATDGKAHIPTGSHRITCDAIKAGRAKGGFVKNWWWEVNREKYPELTAYKVPRISIEKNPDNVLAVSKAISPEKSEMIKEAALASKDAFGVDEMKPFSPNELQFSISLMKKAKIDPATYKW